MSHYKFFPRNSSEIYYERLSEAISKVDTAYNLQLTFSDEIELGLVSFVDHPGQGGDVRDLALSVRLEEHAGWHRHPSSLVTGHWWAAKVRLQCSEAAYRGTGPFMINTIHYKY